MVAEHLDLDILSLIFLTGIFGAISIVVYIVFFKKDDDSDKNNSSKNVVETSKKTKPDIQNPPQQKRKIVKESSSSSIVSSKLVLTSFKGHTGAVTAIDFTSNGKYLISSAEDRTARLWSLKDISTKDHRYTRVNIEFDHASAISGSPDSKAFIVSLATERTLRVYKINKKEGVTVITQDTEDFAKIHKADIINVGISSTGQFIMSADKEAQIIVWSLKGEVYDKIETLLVYNSMASISPCGNLIAACGFTSDVKLWHIVFTKSGSFQQTTKALELKGHTAGILSFSFSNDSKRMATISKDGTWKIWDIDVNYEKGQEAYLRHTGSYTATANQIIHIALSHDYFTVAIAIDKSVYLYDAQNQTLGEVIENVHQSSISALMWYSDSRQLFSAGGTDRTIRVLHNPVGAKAFLKDLQEKLPKSKSEALIERIKQQIVETKTYLSRFQ